MSYGLRAWDSSGNLILEITDSIARFVGTYTIPLLAPRASTVVSVPGYSLDGTWSLYFLTGNYNYLAITEQTNGVYVFNTNYYNNLGNVTFNVFRK